jgi:hypothetical protein
MNADTILATPQGRAALRVAFLATADTYAAGTLDA